jgi:hypothetical protein
MAHDERLSTGRSIGDGSKAADEKQLQFTSGRPMSREKAQRKEDVADTQWQQHHQSISNALASNGPASWVCQRSISRLLITDRSQR